MEISNKKEPFVLLIGDILFLTLSLWLMLLLRYFRLPQKFEFVDHLVPFSLLFFVWISVFFVAGLYEKQTLNIRRKLFSVILNTQIVNTIIAVLFFYFVPVFGIAPKTNLFIYLFVSFVLIVLWRIYVASFLDFGERQRAIIINSGQETDMIKREVNENPRYNLNFVDSIDIDNFDQNKFLHQIKNNGASVVVVDFKDPRIESILPQFYALVFSGVQFVSAHKTFQDIFDRVPLSMTRYGWFLENISSSSNMAYDFLKRLMDIFASLIIGIVSVIFYPFIILAIRLDDGGPVFFTAERVGQNGKIIKLFKFRTMSVASKGSGIENNPQVTRVGNFLRRTRLDELPQLLNILKGELSLIGPRPEFSLLVKTYVEQIPYYNARHLIKPGLSGWAQIYHDGHPHHGVDIEETKNKLSYDLYYVKNRSFILDLKIALKTIKTLLSRSGV